MPELAEALAILAKVHLPHLRTTHARIFARRIAGWTTSEVASDEALSENTVKLYMGEVMTAIFSTAGIARSSAAAGVWAALHCDCCLGRITGEKGP